MTILYPGYRGLIGMPRHSQPPRNAVDPGTDLNDYRGAEAVKVAAAARQATRRPGARHTWLAPTGAA